MSNSTLEVVFMSSDTESQGTEVPSDFDPQSSNTSVTTVSDDSSSSSDDYEDYEHLAQPLWDFITDRVESFQPTTSTHSPDFDSFKTLWRGKFEEMRAELAASYESSQFITDPPLRQLEIEILDNAENKGCPCCFEDRDPDIVITASSGITKDIFVKAVCDGLYGDDVTKDQLPLKVKYDGKLVVKDFQCMTQGGDLYKGSSYDRMRIWMHVAGA